MKRYEKLEVATVLLTMLWLAATSTLSLLSAACAKAAAQLYKLACGYPRPRQSLRPRYNNAGLAMLLLRCACSPHLLPSACCRSANPT